MGVVRRPGTLTDEEGGAHREEQRRQLGLQKRDSERALENVTREIKKRQKELKPLERRVAVLEKAAALGHEGAARQKGVAGDQLGALTATLSTYRSMVEGRKRALEQIEEEYRRIGSSEGEEQAHADADAELEAMAGERANVERERARKGPGQDPVMEKWRREGRVK